MERDEAQPLVSHVAPTIDPLISVVDCTDWLFLSACPKPQLSYFGAPEPP